MTTRTPKQEEKRVLEVRTVEYAKKASTEHVTVSPEIFERIVMWNGAIAGDVAVELAEPTGTLMLHSKVLQTSPYFEAALSWQKRRQDAPVIDLTDRNPLHVHYLLYSLYFPKYRIVVDGCPSPFWEGLEIPLGELPALYACESYLQIRGVVGVRVRPDSLPTIELPRGMINAGKMSVWLDYAGFRADDKNTLVFNASDSIVAWLNSLLGLRVFEHLRLEFGCLALCERTYMLDLGNGLVRSGTCTANINLTTIVKTFLSDKDVWPRFV